MVTGYSAFLILPAYHHRVLSSDYNAAQYRRLIRGRKGGIMTHDEIVGARIRDLRNGMHLSQDELAARAKVTRGAISLYELGKRKIDTYVLMKLCHALEVEPNQLMGVKPLDDAEKRKAVIEEIR